MSKATGLLLIVLGVWLAIASVAGRLPERLLSLVWTDPAIPGSTGEGGPFTGDPDDPPDKGGPGGGGGGGGGGAW